MSTTDHLSDTSARADNGGSNHGGSNRGGPSLPGLGSVPLRALGGAALALLVVVILGVRFVASRQPAPSASSLPGAAPIVGHPAPDSVLLSLDNQQVHLTSFRGKIVVLNFWYASCPPCQLELPTLEHTWQQDASRGVVIVGANTEDTASSISSYDKAVGLTYPVYIDQGGQTVITYGVTATPTTFVIDRAGIVRAKIEGPLTGNTLANALAPLLSSGK